MNSVFFPEELIRCARDRTEPWAVRAKERIKDAAEPWLAMSDDDLWDLMYGPNLPRAWQVWSNGHCLSCKGALPEYSWEIDALARPWKVRCPHCQEIFPKNDFAAFYRSGLDEHGEFDPEKGDRSLLFNEEHPDASDPLHQYGVDDGTGYTDGKDKWRFIAAYLIYGQWKQLIVDGVQRLAEAYTVSGDAQYAHKALLMLDRMSDIYPRMDFAEQGLVYEGKGARGYVSTWHDACIEAYRLTVAYDVVRAALTDADGLVSFLAGKAAAFNLSDKSSANAVRQNIESNFLQHTIDNRDRIQSNFPQTDITVLTAHMVLGFNERRELIENDLHEMLTKATAVDGVTGEKGLSAYSSYAFAGVLRFLASISHISEELLDDIVKKQPRIHEGFRFFIDTWCFQEYYPSCGDAGVFTRPVTQCACTSFERYDEATDDPANKRSGAPVGAQPSIYRLCWLLYKMTDDEAIVQVMHHAITAGNGDLCFGLFHDVTPEIQQEYDRVIVEHGPRLKCKSVDKKEWNLALLRGGEGEDERVMWLDYDTGRAHQHYDGMNLGLYAKGLDLLPDFGYPPTGYGGHETLQAMWYVHTAAHNTVTVNGKCQPGPHWIHEVIAAGETSLWVDTDMVQGIRSNAPDMYEETTRYERTAWMTSVSDDDFYVLDVFRVAGGQDHAKFTRSGFSELTTAGVNLKDGENFVEKALLQNFRTDDSPGIGWTADFKIRDRYEVREPGADVHFRVHDFTDGACAGTLESWINDGTYNDFREQWIPTIMTRRSGDDGLVSTFVAVMAPWEVAPFIKEIRRHEVMDEAGNVLAGQHVAIEITLEDGRTDYHLGVDVEAPGIAGVKEWGLSTDCEACVVRMNADGQVTDLVLCHGSRLSIGGETWSLPKGQSVAEINVSQ